ncbi:DUF3105 domain-containing protein [Nonomuraea sp. NPDC050556]|uniref:DUF3105 domain-containing protein n=1 Tax=Nonomuraea sp. NPDC050556 TaxID=3364369 RepID=UPI0037A867DA
MTKEKSQARREHLAQMRAVQKRKERRTALLMWGAGGAVVLLLVGVVGFYLIKQARETSMDAVARKTFSGGEHVWTPVKYADTPPMGGPHNNYWQQCAVYDKPIHNEHAVHSMEHGAVWITYREGLPKAQVDQLQKIASSNGNQEYMLVSPYKDLPSAVVATTWGNQLKLDKVDDPRLPKFITKYQNGPDTPEPGAVCGGQYAISTTADQAPLPPEPKQNQPQPSESIAPSATPTPTKK